jgi:hypothetical protein
LGPCNSGSGAGQAVGCRHAEFPGTVLRRVFERRARSVFDDIVEGGAFFGGGSTNSGAGTTKFDQSRALWPVLYRVKRLPQEFTSGRTRADSALRPDICLTRAIRGRKVRVKPLVAVIRSAPTISTGGVSRSHEKCLRPLGSERGDFDGRNVGQLSSFAII